jgi:hypothetical protein
MQSPLEHTHDDDDGGEHHQSTVFVVQESTKVSGPMLFTIKSCAVIIIIIHDSDSDFFRSHFSLSTDTRYPVALPSHT